MEIQVKLTKEEVSRILIEHAKDKVLCGNVNGEVEYGAYTTFEEATVKLKKEINNETV
ncbi:MAG: hypothetical protein K0U41_08760 [Gammaproteobacteria bacterium]|nr:hypothetical protein [Gammaproteobacteria bacterium]